MQRCRSEPLPHDGELCAVPRGKTQIKTAGYVLVRTLSSRRAKPATVLLTCWWRTVEAAIVALHRGAISFGKKTAVCGTHPGRRAFVSENGDARRSASKDDSCLAGKLFEIADCAPG